MDTLASRKLPDGWIWSTVADVGDAIVGMQRTPSAQHGDALLPYLRVANVQDDQLDLSELLQMNLAPDQQARYLLQPGDIVLCESQSRELVGRAAMFRGEVEKIFFQNHIIRFRPSAAVLPEYSLLVFRAYQRMGVFAEAATGATGLAHIGLRRFREIPFPLPPLAVQETLSDLSRRLQLEIDYARERLTTVLAYVCEVPRVARDALIVGDSPELEASKLPPLRQQWRWSVAAEIVPEDAPIVYGIIQPGPNILDGTGVPYVRGQDLREGEILTDQLRNTSPTIAQRYARSALRVGDVLLGIIRSTRVAIVPSDLEGGNITQGTARIRPSSEMDSGYLAHWLASASAQEWLTRRLRGIDMPGLNLRDVRLLPIPVAPMSEQTEIADRLDGVVAEAARAEAAVKRAQVGLAELEAVMLTECVFGRTAQESYTRPPSNSSGEDAASTPGASIPTPVVMKGRSRIAPTTAITDVLARHTASVTPEQLFAETGYTEAEVDDFYAELRSGVAAGNIIVDRPDAARVFVRIAR